MSHLLHVRPCPHRAHRATRIQLLGCALAGFAVLAVWDPIAHPGPKCCALRWAVGLPCPACGMTRGVAMLERGRFLEALAYNPLAVPLFAAALVLCVKWAYEFWMNRSVEVVLRPAWRRAGNLGRRRRAGAGELGVPADVPPRGRLRRDVAGAIGALSAAVILSPSPLGGEGPG